jgi:hypothetical protein
VLRAFCLGNDAPSAIVIELRRVVMAIRTDVLRSRLALLRGLDMTDEFQCALVPTLLLRARRDRLVVEPLVPEAGAAMTSAAMIDGPHFLLQVRASECWLAIEAWCADRAVI